MYQKKRTEYESTKSTAYTFLPMGIIGLVLSVLVITDVIKLPINQTTKVEMCVVLSILFVIFIIIGIWHLRALKGLSHEADADEKRTADIRRWFLENYSSEKIDRVCMISDDLSEEQSYFKRYEYMKQELSMGFPELPEEYAEYLLEELYNEIYQG
ncbi:MAG: hypothetical protein ACI4DO_02235 [Roseburia sp.]